MVEDAYLAAKAFRNSILLLDRYFLSVSALRKLQELISEGSVHMEIVTKAKVNCTAYEKPSPRKSERGRPPKKGAAIHLKDLFESHKEQFRETEMVLYGKKENARYYSIDLLWGQGLYQELRFVLVEYNGTQSILAGTSLELDPLYRSSFTVSVPRSNTPSGNGSSKLGLSVIISGQSTCRG